MKKRVTRYWAVVANDGRLTVGRLQDLEVT
jgi:hypothetical protein